ncbi:ABC transporter, ATP-binding protein, putative [marine gamma proteobacterium HTCC2148]|nr:ABC transporter, ATP-binding protein, putative [marine gamma proteobacterium HTCC2148]
MSDISKNPILKLEDVSLSYRSNNPDVTDGTHQVLDSISLDLYEGETLGVIGSNGCGKTTILRIMAGILAPSSGNVTRRRGTSAALLSIGLGFKPNASGRSNAMLAAMLQGATKGQAESYLEEIKEFSELGIAFEEPVKTYSSGMMSRLGFTTALKTHVDILLIDEVLSVGDAHFKQKAEKAIKERISGSQTVVFVSHVSSQVQELCERVIWLNQGIVAEDGGASEVLHTYAKHIRIA